MKIPALQYKHWPTCTCIYIHQHHIYKHLATCIYIHQHRIYKHLHAFIYANIIFINTYMHLYTPTSYIYIYISIGGGNMGAVGAVAPIVHLSEGQCPHQPSRSRTEIASETEIYFPKAHPRTAVMAAGSLPLFYFKIFITLY